MVLFCIWPAVSPFLLFCGKKPRRLCPNRSWTDVRDVPKLSEKSALSCRATGDYQCDSHCYRAPIQSALRFLHANLGRERLVSPG